ncbi:MULTISPECIES: TetR/AcrR family transcriptional regulator [unclassified Streptomyces]|uniref:TetR/AcrR family transcriptional regulator n=1 Tax=unclassified Streptomyces TaxID=2593676 RepID=UPI000AA6797D|nr:TetR family transcriptional regulator [Streptomyces sp. CB01580]
MTSGQATAPSPAPGPGTGQGQGPCTEPESAPTPGPESGSEPIVGAAGPGTTPADPGAAPTGPGASSADPDTVLKASGRSSADPGTGRDAILRAARRAFTQRPYADVTIRGIAADAGVSPSLVVKHFGRKEELFNTVADFGPAAAELLAAPLGTLGRHMVLTLVSRRREKQSDPLLRVVFSLGNRDERSLLRDRFHEQVTDALTARLHGPEAALRAELIAGHLLGLGATLSLHRDGAGARATPEHIADLYAPALQALITGRAADGTGPGR